MLAVALVLALSPFTTITMPQYNEVDRRMTMWHVQYRVFDNATGIRAAKWADEQGDRHLVKIYPFQSGNIATITYRKPVHGSHWRVTSKEK